MKNNVTNQIILYYVLNKASIIHGFKMGIRFSFYNKIEFWNFLGFRFHEFQILISIFNKNWKMNFVFKIGMEKAIFVYFNFD